MESDTVHYKHYYMDNYHLPLSFSKQYIGDRLGYEYLFDGFHSMKFIGAEGTYGRVRVEINYGKHKTRSHPGRYQIIFSKKTDDFTDDDIDKMEVFVGKVQQELDSAEPLYRKMLALGFEDTYGRK